MGEHQETAFYLQDYISILWSPLALWFAISPPWKQLLWPWLEPDGDQEANKQANLQLRSGVGLPTH